MYWLGIDIGSISTDLVLINRDGQIEEALYLKTKGRPAEAVKEGLRELGKKYKNEEIAGVGVTGSGRNLGAALTGADVVKNEITAHGRAVAYIDPKIRTVIEIGGQDSKIILMEDGMVTDFAMNTVCAAGTGSFLDRQAGRMGVTIEQLGEMAALAEKAVSIAGRCAVFAESDIIHKQQMGVPEDQLMAGMCNALAASYMTNVAKGKRIKTRICFQGGVAANRGMRKAFGDLLNCSIFVPEEHKVMGAYGSALLAKDRKSEETAFKGFEIGEKDIMFHERNCGGCINKCRITSIEAEGRQYGCFGDVCGKFSSMI